MSVAKMGLLICEMIDRGWLQVVITTGALVAHGLIENLGRVHYKCPKNHSDRQLYQEGYNRIYDTLEMEKNLDYAEEVVRGVLDRLDASEALSSESLCRELGRYLAEHTNKPGLLRNAYLKGVPVFIPAFTDSELALDVSFYMARRGIKEGGKFPDILNQPNFQFNPFLDLGSYAQKVLHSKKQGKSLGIFTVGGGVPRNWAQQVAPYLEILRERLGLVDIPDVNYQYGVRLCPEPAHWGGLSGSTYSEAISWGKFLSPLEGGRFAEVLCDATISWPVLMKAVMQRIDKSK
jgi:deoxyhypusine synthase